MPGVQGILDPYSLISGGEVESRIDAYAREIHLADAPLFLQLPEEQAPGLEWTVVGEQIRPQKYTLTGALGSGDATMTLNDTSTLQIGDILEVMNTAGTAYEHVQVTAINSGTVVAIDRNCGSVAGSAAVANTPGSATDVFLVGTASTGDEIDKVAFRTMPSTYAQRLETFMYRGSVGGITEVMSNVILPGGQMPRAQQSRVKMTEFLKDLESAAIYGRGQVRSTTSNTAKTGRPTMLGLREIIRTSGNIDESAKSNFTQTQITTLLIQKAIDGGGDPDLLLCSTDLVSGWGIWANGKQQFQSQESSAILGVPITRMYISFGGRVLEIMYDYNLRKGTMAALTKKDIKAKRGRPMFMKPVGSRGDAIEVDFIGDYSIEVGHPSWHAWVGGIGSYA